MVNQWGIRARENTPRSRQTDGARGKYATRMRLMLGELGCPQSVLSRNNTLKHLQHSSLRKLRKTACRCRSGPVSGPSYSRAAGLPALQKQQLQASRPQPVAQILKRRLPPPVVPVSGPSYSRAADLPADHSRKRIQQGPPRPLRSPLAPSALITTTTFPDEGLPRISRIRTGYHDRLSASSVQFVVLLPEVSL